MDTLKSELAIFLTIVACLMVFLVAHSFDVQRHSVTGRYYSYVMAFLGLVTLNYLIYDANISLSHPESDSDRQPSEEDKIQLRTVETFWNPINAYLYREKLLANGISNVKIQDDYLISIDWLYAKAIHGVKLEVPEDHVERSLKLISESVELEQSEAKDACPNCGSTSIYYYFFNHELVFLIQAMSKAIMFGGIPIPIIKRKWVCDNCRNEYQPDLFEK